MSYKHLNPVERHYIELYRKKGKEFARHGNIAKRLRCNTFFARPYHSWERGQNKNANGPLR